MIVIRGKAEEVPGFINVYVDGEGDAPDTVYTIAKGKAGRIWGALSVGEPAPMGGILDQQTYDRWKAEATIEETVYTLVEKGVRA